jgi:hypothetical protein
VSTKTGEDPRCDGPRYYHAVRSSGRLTQALGGNVGVDSLYMY